METIPSQTIKQDDGSDIVSLFKNEFTSTIIPVYIKSLDKELNFREISVKEYKTFAKTAIDNADRPATMYRAMTSLVENVMMSKNIDFLGLTELDRIHILFNLCQSIMLEQSHQMTCPSCGAMFNIMPNVDKINENFNSIDLSDKVYTVEDQNRIYIVTVNFPTIRRLMATLDLFQRKNQGKIVLSESEVNGNTVGVAMAYIHAYIKNITLERKVKDPKKPDSITADLDKMSVDKAGEIIDLIPQTVFSSNADNGIIAKINRDFIDKANSVFQKEKCSQCGTEFNGLIGSVSDFLLS